MDQAKKDNHPCLEKWGDELYFFSIIYTPMGIKNEISIRGKAS
jgi:hypothetical protein